MGTVAINCYFGGCAANPFFVFQTVYRLEDSFDYYGMIKAGEIHDKIFRSILEYIQSDKTYPDVLALNVGHCKICKKCTYLDGEKCCFPDKVVASIELYGIDVNALVTSCGTVYNNGPNTVSLVVLFLF